MTMVSAFQLAGFRHAVGSLWNVLDSAAARTAKLFYPHLASLGAPDPAVALHRAQLAMRERTPLLLTRWAPYIHVGA
ncbi:CHAT domain-containing protein [Streptomyces sp. NPDC058424]|uniref:CHAT domain-containing protein n=1 Tax=Streptomyces sp. NPDC058424 TaxID=3346491 RepID=UPI0036500EE0